jgi:hypothetical protein
MLGWEFPPLFSGGLGIATHGIVKALSPHVSIRLIIPNSAPVEGLSAVNITGLNRVTLQELSREQSEFDYSSMISEVHRIPLAVSPYHYMNQVIEKSSEERSHEITTQENAIHTIREMFSDKDIYGINIMRKVHLFACLSEEIAADGDFDVIHAHDWITFPAGSRIKTRTGKPLVLHVHALETDRAGETSRNEIYSLEKDAMLFADRIVTVSQFTKDQMVKHYQVSPDKISVVHNGIEPLEIQRKPHTLKDKIVVFLGRITHQKGPQFLLETAEKVCRFYPRVKFIVAGTGDQFSHLLETSAYKKLGRKFIFTGFLSRAKVNELLTMADVYFMPSVSEPFGLTALEAVQHHVPCVLSAQSGASEVIHAALKADFWDTDKYANYIYALLRHNALKQELSKNALEELNKLTWSHAAEKIMNVYKEVVSTKY